MLEDRGFTLTQMGNVMTVFSIVGRIGGIAGGSRPSVSRAGGQPCIRGCWRGRDDRCVRVDWSVEHCLFGTWRIHVVVDNSGDRCDGPGVGSRQTSTVSALMMGAAWGVGALAPTGAFQFCAGIWFSQCVDLRFSVHDGHQCAGIPASP